MDQSFTRVAVVQLAYHPAIVLAMRSPLEDPHGVEPLLPASADIPESARPKFEDLRGRIRVAYMRQLLARLQAILDACRGWGVRLVVFPEYSVPWEILDEVAEAAGDMVVVAGTHMVDRDARRSGVYERLGWPKSELPGTRQAVASVLHGGKLLALSPKFHPATAVGEVIEPGKAWAPVAMPEGIVGPMGVMVCLDFLFRENQEHHHLIAEGLKACRFLAVPSLTRRHTVDGFANQSWQEAQRYGRPVLYTNSAEGGGTSIFVDEAKHSGLRSFPEHVGCFDPGDEGVIVADVDLGYTRPGGSTRYDQVRPVRPFAAASFVSRAQPEGDAYARWLADVGPLLARDDDDAVEELSACLEGARAILRSAAALPGAKARKERIERLYSDLRHVTRVEEIRQLTREVVMPAGVLPLSGVRVALAKGAAEAVQEWMGDHPELGDLVKRLREAGTKAADGAWTSDGIDAIEGVSQEARGGERPTKRVMSMLARRGLERIGADPVAHNGFLLSFRRRPEDFALRLPDHLLSLFPPPTKPVSAGRRPETAEPKMDAFSAGMNQALVWEVERRYRLLAAEGPEILLAVGVSTVAGFNADGRLIPTRRRTNTDPTVLILRADGTGWSLHAHPHDSEWMIEDRAEFVAALEFCGFVTTSFEVITGDAFITRRLRLLERFEAGRTVLDEFLNRRLADVGGHFVEPDVSVDGNVQLGSEALDEWLCLEPKPGSRERQVAILLGEYGLGKSTLLASWAARLRKHPGAPLPLFVNLATGSSRDPIALLLQVARLDDTRMNREALRLLVSGRCVLPIFDGFDEMATRVSPGELPARLAELLTIGEQDGKVLLSSRDHYFATERDLHEAIEEAMREVLHGPHNACRLMMRPFDDAKITSLVSLVAGAAATDGIIARLRTVHDLEDLVHRPLLLGMVLSALDRLPKEGTFSRLDLYEVCVDRWLSQTGGNEPEIFTSEQKQELAETIAADLWRSGAPSCSLSGLRNALSKFPSEIFDSVPRMAEVLETTGGMFFVRAAGEPGDQYRFAHESFREYFFARGLVRALNEGTSGVAAALSTKRLTPAIVSFVGEILAREGDPKETASVRAVQRWLQRGRLAWEDDDPELMQTADAAANALRLLLGLGRWAKEPQGWVTERADLRSIRVRGENLRGVRLSGARLNGAFLAGVDLSDANLRGARLDKAELLGATLDGAALAGISARGADFTQVGADKADLTGADFGEAVLRQSMWTACRWEGVKLQGADVTAWAVPGAGAHAVAGNEVTALSSAIKATLATGHIAQVNAIAWSRNGRFLASVGNEGGLFVWDVATKAQIACFDGSEPGRWSQMLMWSADDRCLLCYAGDCFVRRLDVATGAKVSQIQAHDGPVDAVAWAPDGSSLAIAVRGNTVRLLETETLAELVRLEGHTSVVVTVAWSQDGKSLASASADGTVRLWDVATGVELACLKMMSNKLTRAVTWSPDGRRLATAGDDGDVRLWDVASGAEIVRLEGHKATVRSVAWSPNDRQLASGGDDGTVRLWDAVAQTESACLSAHMEIVSTVAWSPDGKLLAGIGTSPAVCVWDAELRTELEAFKGYAYWGQSLAWAPDSRRISSVGPRRSLRLWDVAAGAELALFGGYANVIAAVAWSPNGECLATAGDDDAVRLWNASTGIALANFDDQDKGFHSLAWSPDSKYLAAVGRDRVVRLWNAATRAEHVRFGVHVDAIRTVVWSPDGNRVATTGDDSTVRIWDLASGAEIRRLGKENGTVSSVAWSPDGRRVASTGVQSIRLWNAATGVEEGRLQGDTAQSWTVAWSPDGRRLATAGADCKVRVWDTMSGKEVARLEGPRRWVSSLAWSRDGKRLAAAEGGDVVRLWDGEHLSPIGTLEIAGAASLARSPGGFCILNDGDSPRAHLALQRPDLDLDTNSSLYLPLAGLRSILHRPDKVQAALAGDLSGDDLGAEFARIGWNNGVPWDGEVHFVPVAAPPTLVPAAPVESPAPSPKTVLMTDIKLPKPLLEAYRNDKLALFVGSGLSLGADVKGRFPTWSQLPERLLERCEHYESLDEEALAAKRARFKARMRLEDMLSELGTLRTALGRDYQNALNHIFRPGDEVPGAAHHAVIALGTRALLTTNYDQLFEMVPETPRRQPYTWKEAPKVLGDLRAGRKVLLKVHGTAEHHETVVMSEIEYREARADASYQAVLRYLLQEHMFLFVGYGMNDPLDLDLALSGNLGVFDGSTQRHYVLLKGATEIDCERYERTYNVRAISYAEHAEVPAILARLMDSKAAMA